MINNKSILSILALCLLSVQCLAQSGVFTYKNGNRVEKKIVATTTEILMFDDRTSIKIDSLERVQFYKIQPGDQSTVDKLTAKGVIVEDGLVQAGDDQVTVSKPLVVTPVVTSDALQPQLQNSLNKFQELRSGAKVVQLLGAVTLLAHFVLQNKYAREIEDGNLKAGPPPKFLPIAGCGALTIGLVIDIGAGGHLKIKK